MQATFHVFGESSRSAGGGKLHSLLCFCIPSFFLSVPEVYLHGQASFDPDQKNAQAHVIINSVFVKTDDRGERSARSSSDAIARRLHSCFLFMRISPLALEPKFLIAKRSCPAHHVGTTLNPSEVVGDSSVVSQL